MKAASTEAARDLLLAARGHVRSRTRSARYLEHGDRFAGLFLGRPLGLSSDDCMSVGTDVSVVVDTCYEDLAARGEEAIPLLQQTTRRLGEVLDASLAAASLPALRAELDAPSCPLLQVACAVLGGITLLGCASLSRGALPGAAQGWLSLWQAAARGHNLQQQTHSGLCLLGPLSDAARSRVVAELRIAPAHVRPRGASFSEGVREYLAAFSESAAAAMALVGALPLSPGLSAHDFAEIVGLLGATPELLGLVSGVLRLAQDLTFDSTEPVSTAVVGLAAERRVSVADIDVQSIVAGEVEAKLREEWTAFSREARDRLDRILDRLQRGTAARSTLTAIVDTTFLVAEGLASARHKAPAER
jgi:hypothetical protein